MKTIDTALMMLREIADHGGELSASALSEKMALDKAKVHRNLRALVARGFVEQNPDTRCYRLGMAVVELASVRLRQMNVFRIAPVYMTQLWGETNETVQLSILRDGFITYLHIIQSTHNLRFASQVGDRIEPYYSSAGKLLLAYQPESKAKDYGFGTIKPMTPKTVVEPERLLKELRTIRKRGFAIDDEGWITGLRAVAAPVRDAAGGVVASIAIGGPASRISMARLGELRELLQATVAQVSHDLGWLPE